MLPSEFMKHQKETKANGDRLRAGRYQKSREEFKAFTVVTLPVFLLHDDHLLDFYKTYPEYDHTAWDMYRGVVIEVIESWNEQDPNAFLHIEGWTVHVRTRESHRRENLATAFGTIFLFVWFILFWPK
jgi:hypothetical protein